MKIRIGSRASPLARVQSAEVGRLLAERFPELKTEFVFITTSGDNDSRPVSRSGGKGIFVKEIEESLLDGSVDIAVHSMKDLPSTLPTGLIIGSVPPRQDPSDCVVFPAGEYGMSLESLRKGAKVGTGSIRRACQLLDVRPDFSIKSVRGNIETRIAKMDSGEFDALVLATAALNRLEIKDRTSSKLSPTSFVPAPGQGALAVECRDGDAKIVDMVKSIECRWSRLCVEIERSFLHRIGGDCQVPAGCYVQKNRSKVEVTAFMASSDGSELYREQIGGDKNKGVETGATIAERIMERQLGNRH